MALFAGLGALALVAALRPLAAQQPAPGQLPPVPIKAGIADPSDAVLASYMARAAGLYAAQNLNVAFLSMNGGSRGAEELQAGRLDVMHVGLVSVVKVNQSGGDLRLIAALSNTIRFTFFAAPAVKSAADLKGGTVGVSALGSESDAAVTLSLARLGLTRDDVTIKEIGSSARRLAAVRTGEIKAAALSDPTASIAREEGVNVLVDLVPEHMPWLFTGIAVRRSDIAARHDLLTRFLKATIEGNNVALTDPKRAEEVLRGELKITRPKLLAIAYDDFKAQAPPDLAPSPQAVENVLKLFPEASQKMSDYVDTSLLDGLKKNGFFEAMAQKYKP